MTSEQNLKSWESFLTDQLNSATQEQVMDLGEADRAFKIPLLEHSLLNVEGPDAEKFLQGQTTCDVRLLKDHSLLLGAQCNPQGRMLSSFFAFQSAAQAITLRLPLDNFEAAQAALQKYIVFSKAELHPSPRVGILFLRPSTALQELVRPTQGVCLLEDGVLLRHSDGNIEFWGSVGAAQALWKDNEAEPAPPTMAELWQIRRGLAEVRGKTKAEFIPQHFNYDLIEGLSLTKGCYTGQEIVARLHYKGNTKKRTQRVRLAPTATALSTSELPLGAPIKSQIDAKELGTLLCSASDGELVESLACVKTDAIFDNTLVNIGDIEAKMSVCPLPYAIPNE